MSDGKKYSAFFGRWSPFHNGHDYIIRQALEKGRSVWIGIRDTPLSELDPYTTQERQKMISEHFKDEDVIVSVIPDIESVNIGRKVGYEVIRYDAPKDIEGISATQIRNMMAEGNEGWKAKVPPSIADYLLEKNRGIPGQVIWFTGLSGAGKTTIALEVGERLTTKNKNVILLDADVVRKGLNNDLGFTDKDRDENIRRIGELAKLLAKNGMIVLCSFISPFAEKRNFVRGLLGNGNFKEIYIKCPVQECEKRDPKGLYKKFREGKISHFTGFTSSYEEPINPDLVLHTHIDDIDYCVKAVMNLIN